MRFAGEPAEGLLQVRLDSLTAVYHRRSGQTHLLAEPLPELLDLLSDGPGNVVDILEALGIDDGPEARAALSARLEELLDSGLIARA